MLELPIPPSANHAYTRNQYTGQRVLKKEGKQYVMAVQILTRQAIKAPLPSLKMLHLNFYWPNNRIRDDDNAQKLLMDGLKGFLVVDDNWQRIPAKNIRNELDRDNPRVVVEWE